VLPAPTASPTSSSPQTLPPEAPASSAAGSPATGTATAPKPPALALKESAPALALKEPAPAPASGRRFKVKYRSPASVYVDAGRDRGLSVGDRLRVVSDQETAAELEVVHLSEQSASCRVVSEKRPVRVGDPVVRATSASPDVPTPFTSPVVVAAASPAPTASLAPPTGGPTKTPWPVVAASVASPAPSPAASRSPQAAAVRRPNGPWARARGAASVGYFRSWDRTPVALDLEQRTARLDLGLYDIAGHPLSFSLRARSRQDVRARALSARTPKDERNDRLYELALRYEKESNHLGLEVGRIGLYRFVGIGYLDGGLARYQVVRHVELGGFAGRDADMYGFRPESSGSKYGGFLHLTPSGRSAANYDATLAFVRELGDGEVSREYVSLESRLARGSRWSLFQRAELDLNRGWREELTGKSQQLSNVSLSANLRLSGSASAFVSYNGRRNYRYQRNRLVSEELFDNLFYQGLRAGVNVTRPQGLGFTLGGGMSLREPDPRHPELNLANAYSVNGGLRHQSLWGLAVGVDGSGFTNGYTEGGLGSAHIGRRFGAGHFLDLSYGRSLYRVKETGQDRATQWGRLLARVELGRRVYVLSDFEYNSGEDLRGPRGFLELGVVF